MIGRFSRQDYAGAMGNFNGISTVEKTFPRPAAIIVEAQGYR